MIEVQAFLPGDGEPVSLADYATYVGLRAGICDTRGIPDVFILDDPKSGDRTEIRSVD